MMCFTFEAVVVSVAVRESKDKKYYRLNFEQNDEVFTLDCTEEVARSVKKYQRYRMTGNYGKNEYNGSVYTRIGVVAAEPAS